MANLFWKTKSSTKSLLETPFKTEDEFERMIFGTAELLQDIFLLRRQVRGGAKATIPDIVGVDRDGNVCILELKNTPVDATVIPQVLDYAIWAETNPDSIKSLWLESENRPDDLDIDWDNFGVRIIIIAPSIAAATLQFVQRINYPVDLLEIKRWAEGDNELIMVNRLEQEEAKPRVRQAHGLQTYDEAFYKSERNKTSVDHFLRYVREVEAVIRSKGWPLETKYNRFYVGFKAGFFNAFSIGWMGSKTFAFQFKVPQKQLKALGRSPTKYEPDSQQANFYVDVERTKTADFLPLFEYCYARLAGKV